MSDGGEQLEASIVFSADSKDLDSVLDKSVEKIHRLDPAAHTAQASIDKVWSSKSQATGLHSALESTAKDLDNVAKHAHKAEGGIQGMLHSLKGSLGRRSTLGEVGELLRGAGALAGAAALVEAFHGVATAIVEIHQQGDKTFNGMALAIANNIPILKDFSSGVHELMAEFYHNPKTGKTLNEQNKELEASNTMLDYYRDGRKTTNDIRERGTDKTLREAGEVTSRYQNKQKVGEDTTAVSKRVDELEATYQEQLKQFEVRSKAEYAKRSMERDVARSAINQAYPGEEHKEERQEADSKIQGEYKRRESEIKAAEDKARGAIKSEHDSMLNLLKTGAEALLAIKNQTELIGLTELKAAEAAYKQQGYGADAITAMVQAKGKEIGAQLHQSLMTPMEKYQQEIKNLDELLAAGDISKGDYQKAKWNASHEVLSSVKTNSVEGAFMDNIKNRFISTGINDQIDDLTAQAKKNFPDFVGGKKGHKTDGVEDNYLDTSWDFWGQKTEGQMAEDDKKNDTSKKSKVNPWGYMNQKASGQLRGPTHMDMSDPSGWQQPKVNPDKDKGEGKIDENTKAVAEATDQTTKLNDNLTKLNTTLASGVPATFS